MAEGGLASSAFIFFQRRNGVGRRFAVDPSTDQFADEALVADALALAFGVKPRIEAIVDKAVALTPLDRRAYRVIGQSFALQMLPKTRFGATLPR